MTWQILDALLKYHTSARSLWSSDQQLLTILRSRFKLKAFSVAAPTLWNVLPVSITSALTISSFKSLLKSYLLTQAFNLSVYWVLCSLCLFCVAWCYCLCTFMKSFSLSLYSTLGNNGCIHLCYRNKMKIPDSKITSVLFVMYSVQLCCGFAKVAPVKTVSSCFSTKQQYLVLSKCSE